MDYTITLQYHDKKRCYIYVVRLADRVDKEDFESLSDLAKKHKGYYSSFRGVNGFVFKTEEKAEEFAQDMMAVMDVLQESSAPKAPSKPTEVEEEAPLNQPVSGMELHKALRTVIQTEGDTIITQPRLINILDDFKAYAEMPSAKYILRAIIADGFAHKLLVIGTWNNEAVNLASRFIATTGFMPDAVETIFKSLSYGLGWQKKWENSTVTTTQPTPQSKPLVSSGWTKNMSEEEMDVYILSLVDYDEEGAQKYKVSVENLHFIVDEDEDIFCSCELRKKYRKEYAVNLFFALYDNKGRLRYSSEQQERCVGYIEANDRGSKPVTCYFMEVKASCLGKIKLYWKSPDFY
ncbi:MAG: hypothetical protein HDS80_01030 [Bacteroidales bacterium]|nr:hypothetical protein [Bacteroidales bacterium]